MKCGQSWFNKKFRLCLGHCDWLIFLNYYHYVNFLAIINVCFYKFNFRPYIMWKNSHMLHYTPIHLIYCIHRTVVLKIENGGPKIFRDKMALLITPSDHERINFSLQALLIELCG